MNKQIEKPKTIENIVIVGQGAIGLLWYHHLTKIAESRLHISLISSQQGKKLAGQYQLIDFENTQHINNTVNYSQPNDLKKADIIIFCLKSYQIATAINQVSSKLNSESIIVLAHNGMGILNQLPRRILRQHSIVAMITTHGCLKEAPLKIRHTGLGMTTLGILTEAENKVEPKKTVQLVKQLTKLLNSALPQVNYHNDIVLKQWHKLAINCVINPLTALFNIDNGLINQPEFNQQIDEIFLEIVLVAKAENIELSIKQLKINVLEVAKATAKNCSSMRCDVLTKRPTEIDYINGYIHKLGLKHGIATPVNSHLLDQIKSLK